MTTEAEKETDLFAEFDGLSPAELVRRLDQWQERKEAIEEQLKAINKIYDFLRITKIPTVFDDDGITTLHVEGVGRCSLTPDMHASIKSGQKDRAFEWLRDSGRGDCIVEQVNSSTLKAVLKKATLNGEVPEGLFNISPYTRASITRK